MGGRDGRGAGGPSLLWERTSRVSSQGEWGGHSGSCGLSESPPGSALGPIIFIRGFDPTLATTPSRAPGQI